MKNKVITAFATAACAALLAMPAVAQTAATGTPENHGQATATTKAPRETVTGTITAVDPALRMVTIKDASGTDFNMRVNRSTKIMLGDRQLTLKDLTSDVNKQASVTYIQRSRGDVARAIHING